MSQETKVNLEEDEFYDKIMNLYYEKINTMSKWIQIGTNVGMISFLIFLGLLFAKVSNSEFPTFVLLIFALTTLIFYTIVGNLYLAIKDILDKVENNNDYIQLGSKISYFCLNTSAACGLCYLILLTLKIDNVIQGEFNLIALPFYIFMGISLFYAIFIFPAFVEAKLIVELVLLMLYIISGFIFAFLLNLKLDKALDSNYNLIFIPVYFVLGFHAFVTSFNLFLTKMSFIQSLMSLFAIVGFLCSIVLLGLKLDNIFITTCTPVLVCWIVTYLLVAIPKFYEVNFSDED